jgi:hypothetical protein
MTTDYATLAARRYRRYCVEKSKDSAKESVISFFLKIIIALATALQKVGIVRRGKNIERIIVE